VIGVDVAFRVRRGIAAALVRETTALSEIIADLPYRVSGTACEEYFVSVAGGQRREGHAEPPPPMVLRPTSDDTAAEVAYDAVLGEMPDPFILCATGLPALRAQVGQQSRTMLLYIIDRFDLNPAGKSLSWLSHHQLVTFIVTAVEVQTAVVRRAP